MKNWNRYLKPLILLALILTAHAAFGQSQQPPASSAPNSPSSGTGVSKQSAVSDQQSAVSNKQLAGQNLIEACNATADELTASRVLIDALEKENTALTARLATEKQTTALLTELNETRKAETEALRSAIAAKNEALTAKDTVIATQDKLIETLKRKKSSPWKRIGDVLVGVGIALVLK